MCKWQYKMTFIDNDWHVQLTEEAPDLGAPGEGEGEASPPPTDAW